MLAEIAALNASWAILKTGLQNGKSIVSMATQAIAYFDATAAIDIKAQTEGSLSEAFFARERQRENEAALRDFLIWNGTPGQYDRFLQFKAERKRERDAAAKEIVRKKIKRKQAVMDTLLAGAWILLGVTGIAVLILLIWVVVKLYR